MSALPTNRLITSNDSYDFDRLDVGREYLITVKGTWDGGSIALQFNNGPAGAFADVANGTLNASNEEVRLIIPSKEIRFVLSGATSPSLQITIIRISQ